MDSEKSIEKRDWMNNYEESVFISPTTVAHNSIHVFLLIIWTNQNGGKHSSAFYDFALIKRFVRDVTAVELSDWSIKANVCAVCVKIAGRHFPI